MFEGAGSYLGFGYEQARGIPGPITSYIPFQTESIDPKWGRRANPNINPRRARQKGRLLRVDIAGSVSGAPDSESQTRLRASHQGKVVSTQLTPGVIRHVMTPLMPGDPEEAVYRKTLSGVVYRDDGVPVMVTGGVVNKVTISIREGEYVSMSHDLAFENTTESDQPVPDAGNDAAFTGDLYVRGVRRDPDNEDDPVYVRVMTAGALDGSLPVPLVRAKIGGVDPGDPGYAAEFIGPDIAIVHGEWVDAYDAVQTPIGVSFNNPFQLRFQTDDTSDTLTVGDTWVIDPRIPVINPPFTSREVYDYGQLEALVDGKKYVWKDATIEGTKNKADERGLGSYFTQQFQDNGEWDWRVTLNRGYTSRTFVNLIKAGAVSSFRATLQGARIAATAYRDRHELYIPASQYDEAGSQVGNSGALQERVVMVGFDNGVDPVCTETAYNTLAIGAV